MDLFEFGKTLVQTGDIESLYSKIPQLIPLIMLAYSGELVIAEDGALLVASLKRTPQPKSAPYWKSTRAFTKRLLDSTRFNFLPTCWRIPLSVIRSFFFLYSINMASPFPFLIRSNLT